MGPCASRALEEPHRKGILMKRVFRIFVIMIVVVLVLAVPAAAGRKVPLKGTVLGEHGPPDYSAPGCTAPFDEWRFSSAGEGHLAHVGDVEYSLTQCTVPGDDGYVYSLGTITFTDAKGDTLVFQHGMRSEMVGAPDAPPDGFTMKGLWMADGGTGRYATAKGFGWFKGVGDIPNGEETFDIPDGLLELNFKGKIWRGR